MKKLLLNCDQVFDVLTRGPFPTGDPNDECVEDHLRACHECRQLAEALRPAVALMHEAVGVEQTMDLPEYHGSLPEPLAARSETTRSLSKGLRRIAVPAPVRRSAAVNLAGLANAVRLLAASVLVAALGILLYGLTISTSTRSNGPRVASTAHRHLPDEQGLLTLASFSLPAPCFPVKYEPTSAAHAALLVAAMNEGSLDALRCCTECHRAGLSKPTDSQLVAVARDNCLACHRG